MNDLQIAGLNLRYLHGGPELEVILEPWFILGQLKLFNLAGTKRDTRHIGTTIAEDDGFRSWITIRAGDIKSTGIIIKSEGNEGYTGILSVLPTKGYNSHRLL